MTIKQLGLIVIVLTTVIYDQSAVAADCASVFPETVANSDDDGTITIGFGTQLIDSPDNNIDTTDLDVGPDNLNCELGPCSATGMSVPGGTFSDFPGGSPITLGTFGSGTLAPGNYGPLILGNSATLTLQPGVYTFSGGVVLGNNANIVLSSEGGTSIFTNSGINIGNNIDINQSGSNRDLFIYSNADINIGRGGDIDALIYSRRDVDIGRDTNITGAITAEEDITTEDASFFLPIPAFLGFYNHVNIIYDNSGIDNIPFQGFCDGGLSSGPVLDHFDFTIGSGNASVCEAFEIGITAIDDGGDTFEDYTGTISLTTSTNNGNWQTTATASDAEGTLTPTGTDAGTATYTFEINGADLGEVTLALENTHAETLTITVADTDAGVSSTSGAITFAENAFVISENDNLDEDLIAGRRHQFIVNMRAQDPVTGVCPTAPVAYNVANIQAWINRSAADPGGVSPVINNADTSDTATLNNSQASAELITLNFNDGQALFSLDTSDVGQFSVEFLDASLSFSDQPILGGSDTFTVRPFGFEVIVSGNPQASDSNGSVFTSAGTNFNASVTARAWHTNDDSNDDGIPDFYADTDISNNLDFSGASLSSFGQESPAETISLSSVLVLPSGGNDPGLEEDIAGASTITSFSGGTGNSGDIYFDDVGIIVIDASVSDGSYLGAATTASSMSSSHYVGRFIPSYFELSDQMLAPACVSFSYFAQPFSVATTFTARSSRNTKTDNYQGSFETVVDASNSLAFTAIDTDLPTLLSTDTSHSSTDAWLDGEGSFVSQVTIARPTVLVEPYSNADLGIDLTDGDGVTIRVSDYDLDSNDDSVNDSILVGTTELRFGRLFLQGAHGPETAPLSASFLTQYYDGNEWLTNSDDSCSAIAQSDIEFPDGTIDTTANRTVAIASGATTGQFTDASAGNINFIAGDAGLFFSAPGAGNTGVFPVEVNDLSAYPWLQFDWNQDGDFTDTGLPVVEISFGSFRGHDRIIYWREVLQ